MSESVDECLSVVCDRGDAFYRPGDLLTGSILVKFRQPKKFRALQIKIIGEAVMLWDVQVPKPDDEAKTHFVQNTTREEYLSEKSYLFGSDTDRAIEVPVGCSYKFSFQLPFDLPSSFEHKFGNIRYGVIAVFERPWHFDYEVQTSFRVLANYDLNEKPFASLPIREEIQKRFCCCICPFGKVHATISVPLSGFVPGQMIPVTVRCENESTVGVTRINVFLRRRLEFYAITPARSGREDEDTVAKTICENPFTTTFEDRVTVQLKVPWLVPSSFEHCELIDLNYILKVEICFSGMHCNVQRRFPILIGAIPRQNSVGTDNAPAAMPPQQSSDPVLEEPRPSDAPPSYEVSQNIHGPGCSFAPQHPVRNYGSVNTVPSAPPKDDRW